MIQYRRDVVNFFQDAGFAISEVSELKPGRTYFSNSFTAGTDRFELVRILTDREHWAVWNKSLGNSEESIFPKSDELAWIEVRSQDGTISWLSLSDCNIGASYNPWMIFHTEDHLEAYKKLQTITYDRDSMDDWFDYDYDYDYADA